MHFAFTATERRDTTQPVTSDGAKASSWDNNNNNNRMIKVSTK